MYLPPPGRRTRPAAPADIILLFCREKPTGSEPAPQGRGAAGRPIRIKNVDRARDAGPSARGGVRRKDFRTDTGGPGRLGRYPLESPSVLFGSSEITTLQTSSPLARQRTSRTSYSSPVAHLATSLSIPTSPKQIGPSVLSPRHQ
jgi:hypothetical protein